MNQHAAPANKSPRLLSLIGPGVLVAATGVGAGDLLTAGYAGAEVGVALFWAVLLGAAMKWTLSEGIARWQMATGTTVLEAWARRLHLQWFLIPFLAVFGLWLGAALIKGCGLAANAVLPIDGWFQALGADTPLAAKLAVASWGVLHSLLGLVLVLVGGYRLFERVMSVFVVMMVLTVGYCAIRLAPRIDWAGLDVLSTFARESGAAKWRVALLGGVGGTITLLSYSYWIQEERREGRTGLRACRLDLAIGYTVTAFFGLAMLIITSNLPTLSKGGAELLFEIGRMLEPQAGAVAKYAFLVGAWGAIFSSLLGVWQGVPYLFADFVHARRRSGGPPPELTRTWAYRGYMLYLALPSLALLMYSASYVQVAYAVLGAALMPLMAGTLLWMNNRRVWIAGEFRNGVWINLALGATLAFFAWQLWQKVVGPDGLW